MDDYFNPRSPYGERQGIVVFISLFMIFQSTLPIRGATDRGVLAGLLLGISIHAPHTGSDDFFIFVKEVFLYFNPRSPYGERRVPDTWSNFDIVISIHAPHTGSDAIKIAE